MRTKEPLRDGPLKPTTQRRQRTVRWHWHVGRPTATEAPVFAFHKRFTSSPYHRLSSMVHTATCLPHSPAHNHNGSSCMHLALPEKGRIPRTLTLHPTDHLFVLGQSSRKALHSVQQLLYLDTKLPNKSARSGC